MASHAAIETQVYDEWDCYPMISVSPDGRWGFGWYADSYITIYDIEGKTWETYDYYTLGVNSLGAGLGQLVSNDGTILAMCSLSGGPFGYWHQGKWRCLDNRTSTSGFAMRGGFLNSVTSEGEYLAGLVYTDAQAGKPSFYPGLWAKSGDGTYGSCTILPVPDTDCWGGVPQGCYAQCVSDDGRHVAIGVTTSWGGFDTEIGYASRGDDGSYIFHWLAPETYLYPTMARPEKPNTESYPYPIDYMTAAENQAYLDAVDDWVATYDAVDNPIVYPDRTDFMTDDELAAYTAALEAYRTAWNAYYDACDALNQERTEGVNAGLLSAFEQNCMTMSANGRWLAATSFGDNVYTGQNSIYLFDLDDGGSWVRIRPEGLGPVYALSVMNDGTVSFVDNVDYELVQCTYVYTPEGEVQPVQDWLLARGDQAAYEWMRREMRHSFTGPEYTFHSDPVLGDYFTGELIDYTDKWVTGQLHITPDGRYIAGHSLNWWYDGDDGGYPPVAYSYIIASSNTSLAPVYSPDLDYTPVYYTLQGIPVLSPSPGQLLIERRGPVSRKVII